MISSSGVSVQQSGDSDAMKPKSIMDLKNITSLLSNIPPSISVEMKDVTQVPDGSQLDLTVAKSTLENSSLEKTPLSAIGMNLLPSNVLHGKKIIYHVYIENIFHYIISVVFIFVIFHYYI